VEEITFELSVVLATGFYSTFFYSGISFIDDYWTGWTG
jgi:hypothetical protein